MDALDLLKTVLDGDRLAVLGLVAAGAPTAEELSEHTGLPLRAVLATLAPLVQEGLVSRDADRYRLDRGLLRQLAQDLPQPPPVAPQVLRGMTADEAGVLRRFFRGDQLVGIPSSRGKRRVVLERIALDFEPGIRYPEAQVNTLLQRYHADYAALRRHLVDEGLLDRAGAAYWRSGGRVEGGSDLRGGIIPSAMGQVGEHGQ